jgi:hypothetical protein
MMNWLAAKAVEAAKSPTSAKAITLRFFTVYPSCGFFEALFFVENNSFDTMIIARMHTFEK